MPECLMDIYLHLINHNNLASGVDWGQNRQQYTVFGRLQFGCPNYLKWKDKNKILSSNWLATSFIAKTVGYSLNANSGPYSNQNSADKSNESILFKVDFLLVLVK